jgi:hypothetical protein
MITARAVRLWYGALVAGAFLVLCLVIGSRLYEAVLGVRPNFGNYEKAMKAYREGVLKDEDGTVELPAGLARGTVDRRMYVTHEPWGNVYVFRTWNGRLPDFRGYAFVEGSRDFVGTNPELVLPGLGANEKVQVDLEWTGRDGWYKASRVLD